MADVLTEIGDDRLSDVDARLLTNTHTHLDRTFQGQGQRSISRSHKMQDLIGYNMGQFTSLYDE